MQELLIGTAGWAVDRSVERFAREGSALERYASVFSAVEINSSFHRRHRATTWQRWHDAVPSSFRFSVKLPKAVTHERLLVGTEDDLDTFFADVAALGSKLRAILIQLPPKLAFQVDVAARFMEAMRERSHLPMYLEPRHPSWAGPDADDVLQLFQVGRVYADPQDDALRNAASEGDSAYLRLHGSPNVYRSAYSTEELAQHSAMLSRKRQTSWCIFDNTASGAAIHNAIELLDLIT